MRHCGLQGGLQMAPRKSNLFSLPVAPPHSCPAWAWEASAGHRPKVPPRSREACRKDLITKSREPATRNRVISAPWFLLPWLTPNNWHSFRRLGRRPLLITKTVCTDASSKLPFSQLHSFLLCLLSPQEAETTQDRRHWGAASRKSNPGC